MGCKLSMTTFHLVILKRIRLVLFSENLVFLACETMYLFVFALVVLLKFSCSFVVVLRLT